MGKLASLFFEPKEEMSVDTTSTYEYEEEDTECVTDGVNAEDFVNQAYEANDKSDKSKSVYRINELIKAFPKEMPTKTKRETIFNLMPSMGLDTDSIITDANDRIQILNFVSDKMKSNNDAVIEDNNINIESLKEQIARLEEDNSRMSKENSDYSDAVTAETAVIEGLITFIKGE